MLIYIKMEGQKDIDDDSLEHQYKHAILAKTSQDVYYRGINDAEKELKMYLPNHKLDRRFTNNGTAVIVNNNHEVVVSYRPTDPFNREDIKTDILEVALQFPLTEGRFHQAEQKYLDVKKSYPNSKISTTGYSLGGSLGMYVARKHNLDGHFFNVGSSPLQLPEELGARLNSTKQLHIYHTEYDPISISNKLIDINDKIITRKTKYFNFHSLANFLPDKVMELEERKFNNWMRLKNVMKPINEIPELVCLNRKKCKYNNI